MLTIIARTNGGEARSSMDFRWGVRPRDCLFMMRNRRLIEVPEDPAWCTFLTLEEARRLILLRVPPSLQLDEFIPGDDLVIEFGWSVTARAR